ncbi:MAG: protein-disulfide reductase DsbD family protein [Novosphingobium sp.]|nr:protein-disulfide reductase DsbD family protein [Novosphingobium sp.]
MPFFALRRLLAGLALLLSALWAGPALSQNNIYAELAANGAAAPGGTMELALHFRPAEGWHGYWTNPGDAGYGMTLKWDLPPGWSAGEPDYPVPHTLKIGPLMNHVYEGDYAVLVPVRVPADAKAGEPVVLRVDAQWLACTDTICVPERAALSTTVLPGAGLSDARFDAWRAAIPAMLDRPARFELDPRRVRIAIPLPAQLAVGAPHLFVGTTGLVDYAAPQRFTRKGDWLVADLVRKGPAKPDSVTGILRLDAEGDGVRFAAQAGDVPAGGKPLATDAVGGASLWLLLAGALAGGLLLNVMPCVFPILSLKALSLARAGESEADARREGLAYTAGVVLACLALGALLLALRAGGEQVGWAFQLQEPGVVVGLLLLAAAITANLAGLFELPSLPVTREGKPGGAFATGLLAAFVATPCTGPFMAAAMGAALLLPVAQAMLLFAALGLGLALPFLALGWVPHLRALLPRPGAWMTHFRHVLAIPMGLTALALLWLTARLGGKGFALMTLLVLGGVLVALAVVGRLQRAGKMAWPAFGLIVAPFLLFGAFALPASFAAPDKADAGLLAPRDFSEAALAEARASGKPVFLWFTADWCVTCKVNEEIAIEREATRDAFAKAGVVAMRGDWTRRDPAITRFLTAHGAAGVPLYLWYPAGGEAQKLPQVLGPDSLVTLAGQAALPASSAPAGGTM